MKRWSHWALPVQKHWGWVGKPADILSWSSLSTNLSFRWSEPSQTNTLWLHPVFLSSCAGTSFQSHGLLLLYFSNSELLFFLHPNACQRFVGPCVGSSTFGPQLLSVRAPKQSMERKTWWFWLRSAGYLWRGSIHPFVLCGRRRCGWEFWEVRDLNQAPPPTCRWTASGFGKRRGWALTGSWASPAPSWPTLSFFWLHCTCFLLYSLSTPHVPGGFAPLWSYLCVHVFSTESYKNTTETKNNPAKGKESRWYALSRPCRGLCEPLVSCIPLWLR